MINDRDRRDRGYVLRRQLRVVIILAFTLVVLASVASPTGAYIQ